MQRVRILLPLILSATLGAVSLAATEEVEERFEKGYDLAGIATVRIQNVNGNVQVETWDQGHLHLLAVKKARGSGAEETLKETEIRVTKRGSTIDIETIPPRQNRLFGLFTFGGDRIPEVSYEVSLPASIALDVETVNGRITTSRRGGSMALSTVNGSVRVDSHQAPLKVNTVNGSVDVAFAGPMKKADLETVNGSVTVACGRDSSIRYEIQTVNGQIRSEFPNLTVEGKWGPKEARGEINGGRERLSVETVNGEVRLKAVDSAPAAAVK